LCNYDNTMLNKFSIQSERYIDIKSMIETLKTISYRRLFNLLVDYFVRGHIIFMFFAYKL